MRIRVCIAFYSEFEACKPGLRDLAQCKDHEFVIEPRQGTYIGATRNSLINDLKSSEIYQSPVEGFEAFLDIDSDIAFTLENVLQLIGHDKNIVCSPYLKHHSNTLYQVGSFDSTDGNIASRYDVGESGLKPVDWSGNGFRLTKRAVYEKMAFPWYRHQMVKVGEKQKEAGEDVGFCMNARAAGFEIWCDFDNQVQHRQRTEKSFNWELTGMNENQSEKAVLKGDLSPCLVDINRAATFMIDQYSSALDEIRQCHAKLSEQKETIKAQALKIVNLETEAEKPIL